MPVSSCSDQCEPTGISPMSPLDLTSSTESNGSSFSSQNTAVVNTMSSSMSVVSASQMLTTLDGNLEDFDNSTGGNMPLFDNASMESSRNVDHQIDIDINKTMKCCEEFSSDTQIDYDRDNFQIPLCIKPESDSVNTSPIMQKCVTPKRARKSLSLPKRSESPGCEDFFKTEEENVTYYNKDIDHRPEMINRLSNGNGSSGNHRLSNNNKQPVAKPSIHHQHVSKSPNNKYLCKKSVLPQSSASSVMTTTTTAAAEGGGGGGVCVVTPYATRSKSRESLKASSGCHRGDGGRRRGGGKIIIAQCACTQNLVLAVAAAAGGGGGGHVRFDFVCSIVVFLSSIITYTYTGAHNQVCLLYIAGVYSSPPTCEIHQTEDKHSNNDTPVRNRTSSYVISCLFHLSIYPSISQSINRSVNQLINRSVKSDYIH
ncbi:unnamed protein product [Trichobilharzia regenti]|nr:unnamed protein product [Trichobilharzia regenti]